MTRYLTIGYGDRAGYDRTSDVAKAAAHTQDDRLRRTGLPMGIAGTPVCVRNHEGAGVSTTQGSFLTATLPVAGFAVIEADDIEHAVDLASQTPCAVAYGVVEIWPLLDVPAEPSKV